MAYSVLFCFASHCSVTAHKSLHAICATCRRRIYDVSGACDKHGADSIVNFALREILHVACSRSGWDVKFAICFRNEEISVPKWESLKPEIFKEPEPLIDSSALVESMPPVPFDIATDIVEDPVTNTFAAPLLVSETCDHAKTEYCIKASFILQPAQSACLIYSAHVRKLCTTVCKDSSVTSFGALVVAKHFLADYQSAASPVGNGNLAVLRWQGGSCLLLVQKNSAPLRTKQPVSVSHILNVASSAGKPRSFFDRMNTAISCCRLFALGRSLKSSRNIVVVELTKDVQQHRLLESIKSSPVFRFVFIFVRLVSSEGCYVTFNRVSREPLDRKMVLAMT